MGVLCLKDQSLKIGQKGAQAFFVPVEGLLPATFSVYEARN